MLQFVTKRLKCGITLTKASVRYALGLVFIRYVIDARDQAGAYTVAVFLKVCQFYRLYLVICQVQHPVEI